MFLLHADHAADNVISEFLHTSLGTFGHFLDEVILHGLYETAILIPFLFLPNHKLILYPKPHMFPRALPTPVPFSNFTGGLLFFMFSFCLSSIQGSCARPSE